MNLIKADDEMFGNRYYTTINDYDYDMVGVRPHIAWGCSGLAMVDGEWHLFNEDDGHYWSIGVVYEDEIEAVKNGLIELRKHMKIDKYDCTFKNDPPDIKSDLFQFEYVIEKNQITSLIVKIRDIVDQGHPFWIDALINCFSLKLNDPK